MPKALIYARVSSKEQEREGHSIPAQLGLLREYAQRNGMEVAHEYTEAETARSAGREQFGVMLRRLGMKDAPQIVLVEKTDRLYRNFRDYVAIEALMADRDIEIHLVKEAEILNRDARSSLKFIHGIKVLMAKNYIDNLSEEVKKGQRQAVLEGGWPWQAPYGYQKINRELVPDPEQARFVQAAFNLYAAGHSIASAIEALHAQGYRYRDYQARISKSRFNDMIKNRIYLGEIEYQGEVSPGRHAPLIDQETWNAAQQALRKDGKPLRLAKQEFLYRGVLTCGECGAGLVGEHKKGGKYTYYRCVDMRRTCSQGYISEAVIDSEVQQELKALLKVRDLRGDILGAVQSLDGTAEATYQEELGQIETAITKARSHIKRAYHDRLDGAVSDELWAEVSQTYQEKIDALLARREALSRADINYMQTALRLLELPERLTTGWEWANLPEKQLLLGMFTSNFFVNGGKARLELKEPFRTLGEKGSRNEWLPSRDDLRTFLTLHHAAIDGLHSRLAA